MSSEAKSTQKNMLLERVDSVLAHSSSMNPIIEAFISLDNIQMDATRENVHLKGERRDLRLDLEWQNIQLAKTFLNEFDSMQNHINDIDVQAESKSFLVYILVNYLYQKSR